MLAAALCLVAAACGGATTVEPSTPTEAAAQGEEAVTTTTAAASDEPADQDESRGSDTDHSEEPDHSEDGDHTDATDTTQADTDHDEDSHDHADAGHEDETAADHSDERVVHVTMTEFAFDPAALTVSAGETVRFVIVNEGSIPHEFRLSNTHRIEEHLASGHADHEEAGGHHDEGGDVFIEVAAGDTDELVFTFPTDIALYADVACLIPGHYEAGMVGTLTYG